jgi:hypothetical protein
MAAVRLSKVSLGKAVSLFGSSVRTNTVISLEICESEVDRHLNQDWHHPKKTVVELWMTPAQFAEMITSFSVGEGVPATFRYREGAYLQPPVLPNKSEQFKEEVLKDVALFKACMSSLQRQVSSLFNSGKANKSQLKEISDSILQLNKLSGEHLPFIIEQFGRQMDKTVHEAKLEVDAFVTQVINKTGIEALRDKAPMLQVEQGKETNCPCGGGMSGSSDRCTC